MGKYADNGQLADNEIAKAQTDFAAELQYAHELETENAGLKAKLAALTPPPVKRKPLYGVSPGKNGATLAYTNAHSQISRVFDNAVPASVSDSGQLGFASNGSPVCYSANPVDTLEAVRMISWLRPQDYVNVYHEWNIHGSPADFKAKWAFLQSALSVTMVNGVQVPAKPRSVQIFTGNIIAGNITGSVADYSVNADVIGFDVYDPRMLATIIATYGVTGGKPWAIPELGMNTKLSTDDAKLAAFITSTIPALNSLPNPPEFVCWYNGNADSFALKPLALAAWVKATAA